MEGLSRGGNFWLTDEQFAALGRIFRWSIPGRSGRMIGASSAGSSTGCVKAVDGVRFRMNTGRIRRCSTGTIVGASAGCGSVCSPLSSMRRSSRAHHDRQFGGEGASFGERRPKGGSKTKPLADRAAAHDQDPCHRRRGRPTARLPLTGGNVADIKGAEPLLDPSRRASTHRRQGIRRRSLRLLDGRSTTAVIPNKSNRKRHFLSTRRSIGFATSSSALLR